MVWCAGEVKCKVDIHQSCSLILTTHPAAVELPGTIGSDSASSFSQSSANAEPSLLGTQPILGFLDFINVYIMVHDTSSRCWNGTSAGDSLVVKLLCADHLLSNSDSEDVEIRENDVQRFPNSRSIFLWDSPKSTVTVGASRICETQVEGRNSRVWSLLGIGVGPGADAESGLLTFEWKQKTHPFWEPSLLEIYSIYAIYFFESIFAVTGNWDGGTSCADIIKKVIEHVLEHVNEAYVAQSMWLSARYATYAGLAEVDAEDHQAAAAKLPGHDSLVSWQQTPFLLRVAAMVQRVSTKMLQSDTVIQGCDDWLECLILPSNIRV